MKIKVMVGLTLVLAIAIAGFGFGSGNGSKAQNTSSPAVSQKCDTKAKTKEAQYACDHMDTMITRYHWEKQHNIKHSAVDFNYYFSYVVLVPERDLSPCVKAFLQEVREEQKNSHS